MVYLGSTLVADMLVHMMKVLVDVLVTIAKVVSDEVSQHIPVVLGINFLLEENKAFEKILFADPDHYSKSHVSLCI
jgi:F420-0:gamma-glutamyl ligase